MVKSAGEIVLSLKDEIWKAFHNVKAQELFLTCFSAVFLLNKHKFCILVTLQILVFHASPAYSAKQMCLEQTSQG